MIHISPQVHEKHTTQVDCLGVVLAGGLSSRMGVDKSTLQRNNTSMLTYSKQLLTDSGIQNIVISGNAKNNEASDNVITDIYKESGPLGGIASIIQKCRAKSLLILPVDLPLMTACTLQKIKHIGELSQQACFYEENYLPLYLPINAHVESFFNSAFINTNIEKKAVNTTSNLMSAKSKNGPSIRALLKQIPHQAIKCDSPSTLFNANTPEDWQSAQLSFANPKLATGNIKHIATSKISELRNRKPYV